MRTESPSHRLSAVPAPFCKGALFAHLKKLLSLPLHVHQFFQHLVGDGDDAGVGLIAALGGNHFGELVGHVGAGGLQTAVLDGVFGIREDSVRWGSVSFSGTF